MKKLDKAYKLHVVCFHHLHFFNRISVQRFHLMRHHQQEYTGYLILKLWFQVDL